MQLRRIIERRLMRSFSVRVVAASSFTAGSLAGDCRATILPPGLSGEWFGTLSSARATAEGDTQRIRLVTAFRLASWREKGLPQLIEALAALRRCDVQLAICGTGTPPPDLVEVVRMHEWCTLEVGLTDRELAEQLASADLFVLATRTRPGRGACGEGFGLVLLEAQVAGTPVIVPAFGGSADAYIERVTGFSPADESVETLTWLLRRCLADPERLAWMGKRAAEWAHEAFAPNLYAELVVSRLL
jgi:glycosyltransferase involved in cell wall biosynthesis